MAYALRHAAGRSTYEVHEVLGAEPSLDLGSRFECSDYLDAFDWALEFLQQHDPEREGKVSGLAIERVEGNQRKTVWAYRHEDAELAPADLVAHWGFDPTRRWHGPAGLTA